MTVPTGVESSQASGARGSRVPDGRTVIRNPLVRTAWPLVVNTGANGILGVAYWMVAARLYSQDTVATNTALLSAMMTLSGIAQLNLGQTLAVLVPQRAGRARRVVAQSYGAVTLMGVLVLAVFVLLVLPHLDHLSRTLDTRGSLLLFAGGVLFLNLFALQDTALVAQRLGRVVPVENTAFGVAKIVLLVPLLALLPGLGIYVSWVVPMVVLVPVISLLVFRRRSGVTPERRVAPPSSARSLVGLDYVGYLFQVSSTLLLPLIALELLGPGPAAVFAIAWQTSTTLDLLATNVGTALTVESSYGHDPAALRRTVLRYGVMMVGAVSAVGILAAPLILRLYGAEYGAEGVTTLRLLLLASLARSLCTFVVAEARAHHESVFIVWFRVLNAVLVVGLAAVLAPRMGVEGMASAWLAAQLVGAAVVLHRWRRPRVLLEVP